MLHIACCLSLLPRFGSSLWCFPSAFGDRLLRTAVWRTSVLPNVPLSVPSTQSVWFGTHSADHVTHTVQARNSACRALVAVESTESTNLFDWHIRATGTFQWKRNTHGRASNMHKFFGKSPTVLAFTNFRVLSWIQNAQKKRARKKERKEFSKFQKFSTENFRHSLTLFGGE